MNAPISFPAGTPILTGDVKFAKHTFRTPAAHAQPRPHQPRPQWLDDIFVQASVMVARAIAGVPLITAEEYGRALDDFAAGRPDMKGAGVVHAFHRAFPEFAKCVNGREVGS